MKDITTKTLYMEGYLLYPVEVKIHLFSIEICAIDNHKIIYYQFPKQSKEFQKLSDFQRFFDPHNHYYQIIEGEEDDKKRLGIFQRGTDILQNIIDLEI